MWVVDVVCCMLRWGDLGDQWKLWMTNICTMSDNVRPVVRCPPSCDPDSCTVNHDPLLVQIVNAKNTDLELFFPHEKYHIGKLVKTFEQVSEESHLNYSETYSSNHRLWINKCRYVAPVLWWLCNCRDNQSVKYTALKRPEIFFLESVWNPFGSINYYYY